VFDISSRPRRSKIWVAAPPHARFDRHFRFNTSGGQWIHGTFSYHIRLRGPACDVRYCTGRHRDQSSPPCLRRDSHPQARAESTSRSRRRRRCRSIAAHKGPGSSFPGQISNSVLNSKRDERLLFSDSTSRFCLQHGGSRARFVMDTTPTRCKPDGIWVLQPKPELRLGELWKQRRRRIWRR
jgi:hypothetical protein